MRRNLISFLPADVANAVGADDADAAAVRAQPAVRIERRPRPARPPSSASAPRPPSSSASPSASSSSSSIAAAGARTRRRGALSARRSARRRGSGRRRQRRRCRRRRAQPPMGIELAFAHGRGKSGSLVPRYRGGQRLSRRGGGGLLPGRAVAAGASACGRRLRVAFLRFLDDEIDLVADRAQVVLRFFSGVCGRKTKFRIAVTGASLRTTRGTSISNAPSRRHCSMSARFSVDDSTADALDLAADDVDRQAHLARSRSRDAAVFPVRPGSRRGRAACTRATARCASPAGPSIPSPAARARERAGRRAPPARAATATTTSGALLRRAARRGRPRRAASPAPSGVGRRRERDPLAPRRSPRARRARGALPAMDDHARTTRVGRERRRRAGAPCHRPSARSARDVAAPVDVGQRRRRRPSPTSRGAQHPRDAAPGRRRSPPAPAASRGCTGSSSGGAHDERRHRQTPARAARRARGPARRRPGWAVSAPSVSTSEQRARRERALLAPQQRARVAQRRRQVGAVLHPSGHHLVLERADRLARRGAAHRKQPLAGAIEEQGVEARAGRQRLQHPARQVVLGGQPGQPDAARAVDDQQHAGRRGRRRPGGAAADGIRAAPSPSARGPRSRRAPPASACRRPAPGRAAPRRSPSRCASRPARAAFARRRRSSASALPRCRRRARRCTVTVTSAGDGQPLGRRREAHAKAAVREHRGRGEPVAHGRRLRRRAPPARWTRSR